MFLKKEIENLSSFNSHEKAAAGRMSWFDPGAEDVSRLLFCTYFRMSVEQNENI